MVNKTLRFGRRIYTEDRAEDGTAQLTLIGTQFVMGAYDTASGKGGWTGMRADRRPRYPADAL